VTAGDLQQLARLLGPPELAWLRERVRARAVSAGPEPLSGMVRLSDPSPAQRAAVIRLVGPPRRPGRAVSVDLGDVETVLRRGPWPAGLVDAVVALTGPVVDRAAAARAARDGWDLAQRGLTGVVVREGFGAWWADWCDAGGLKRAARAEAARRGVETGPEVGAALVADLARVLAVLPAAGTPIAVFARQVLGDAHALDADRPLGRLAALVVAAAHDPAVGPRALVSRRDVWARAGVVLSTIASTVVCLGVPGAVGPRAAHPLAEATSRALEAMRAGRAPVVLTLDQVRSGGVAPAARGTVVHVCENPTVVEVAAARWATAPAAGTAPGPVLVCTSGQPSSAVLELLEVLTADGAVCRYHGDFDWAGLQIAEVVRRRVPWEPWRFTARDYRSAEVPAEAPALRGRRVEASWDPALAEVMALTGRAVEEEAVVDDLVDDLAGDPVGRGAEPPAVEDPGWLPGTGGGSG
jgi:uncharacterized protein (TIGR02679 family)